MLNLERENRKLKVAVLSKQAMLCKAQSQTRRQCSVLAKHGPQLMQGLLTVTMFILSVVVIGRMSAEVVMQEQRAGRAAFGLGF